MMTRIFTFLLATGLCFLMTSCGSGNSAATTANGSQQNPPADSATNTDTLIPGDSGQSERIAGDTIPPLPQDSIPQGKWYHSPHEDSAGISFYRPEGYPLKPARGRVWFEWFRNGEVIWHPIAPADGSLTVKGTWKREAAGSYSFIFSADKSKPVLPSVMMVVRQTKDLLCLKF